MSQSYQISRLNKGLEAFSATYYHDATHPLSKRDASIKDVFTKFLSEQNFIYDPSRASFIRDKVFSLSPQELDVILGVWQMLRVSKKIPKDIPQRFAIKGLCSITIIKHKGKQLFIHQKDENDTGCEKRGLLHQVALGLTKKTVRFFRETHSLQPKNADQKALATTDKVTYACRSLAHKANFSVSCSLEKRWSPLNMQDLLQWRARFGRCKEGMSQESELFVVASVANYLGFLTLFNASCGGFKMKDLKLSISQNALQAYGAKAPTLAPSFVLNKIETVIINSQHHCFNDPKEVCKDLNSLHYLLRTLITHSPDYSSVESSLQEQLEQFLGWIEDFKEDLGDLEIIKKDSFEHQSLQLLYDSLSEIDSWSDDLEGFVKNFFEKHLQIIKDNSLLESISNINI